MKISFKAEELEEYAYHHTKAEDNLLAQLINETRSTMDYPEMLSERIVSNLLKVLISCSGSKNIIEIGTFTGYSALSMAESLPVDGKIITCEIDPKAIAIAKKYFNKSEHGYKIQIEIGNALDIINNFPEELNGKFDFAFIDADKENYFEYYKAIFTLIKPGGLIVLDNALWSGRVLYPLDNASFAIAKTNEYILKDNFVDNVLLTVRDGINIVRKK